MMREQHVAVVAGHGVDQPDFVRQFVGAAFDVDFAGVTQAAQHAAQGEHGVGDGVADCGIRVELVDRVHRA